MFASRLKKSINDSNKPEAWIGKGSTDKWIQYAKEYLKKTSHLGKNTIVVNYNQWFSDIEYRKKISKKLSLSFTDSGFLEVPHHGGGSSFDGSNFNMKAADMDVLNRWRAFKDDKRYKAILENKELAKLSDKIFGKIIQ
jgi:hypothetical protein